MTTVAIAPILSVACFAKEEADETIVFDLKTTTGVAGLYETFLSSSDHEAEGGNYSFKIGDSYLTNEWTASEIKSIKSTPGDSSFNLTNMGLVDASDTIEDAFNNMPRLEDWTEFVGDATDGVLNKYLYYSADEINADPSNDGGNWGSENIKGHEIYTKSRSLIVSAFGTLPVNIDLYHVERGGDSAKNLYFKLIDRDTNEVLEESFKIDIKWNSAQEDINEFGNGFFSKMINYGEEMFGRTKALFGEIVAKYVYTELRPLIVVAVEYLFLYAANVIWSSIKPVLVPFSYIPGAETLYFKLMDIPISAGEYIVMSYLDNKFN